MKIHAPGNSHASKLSPHFSHEASLRGQTSMWSGLLSDGLFEPLSFAPFSSGVFTASRSYEGHKHGSLNVEVTFSFCEVFQCVIQFGPKNVDKHIEAIRQTTFKKGISVIYLTTPVGAIVFNCQEATPSWGLPLLRLHGWNTSWGFHATIYFRCEIECNWAASSSLCGV